MHLFVLIGLDLAWHDLILLQSFSLQFVSLSLLFSSLTSFLIMHRMNHFQLHFCNPCTPILLWCIWHVQHGKWNDEKRRERKKNNHKNKSIVNYFCFRYKLNVAEHVCSAMRRMKHSAAATTITTTTNCMHQTAQNYYYYYHCHVWRVKHNVYAICARSYTSLTEWKCVSDVATNANLICSRPVGMCRFDGPKEDSGNRCV